MVKKTFRNMAMATGLAAIVAGFGGCAGGAPRAPPVAPWAMMFNVGHDFKDARNAQEAQDSQTRTPQGPTYVDDVIFVETYDADGKFTSREQSKCSLYPTTGTVLPSDKGVCKVVYKNGDSYEGEYKNGFFHGRGKYTTKEGNVREGLWNRGRFIGKEISSKN
ncbi:MAG: hypothetical protein QXS38_01605 [Candidatus Pacearchaeota archaeon]